jgi:hypothetical protein
VGKLPRVLVVLRMTRFKLSMAFVVYTAATAKPEIFHEL